MRAQIREDAHAERLRLALGELASGLGARDPSAAAARLGGASEVLTLWPGTTPDSLFSPSFEDSILSHALGQGGVVQGPRRFGRTWAVWRVETADTAYLPPFEAVRARAERDAADDERERDEAEGREYFTAHRADYKTPVRYVVDYVAVPVPSPDSVAVPGPELRAYYERNRASFEQPEQVRPRVILVSTRGATPAADARARARADSLLRAARGGADFAELARRFSDDIGSVQVAGDLGWRAHGQYTLAVEQAAFALQPGEIGPIVKTPFGYHIIKLEDRRPARTRTFEEASPEIRNRLALERADTTAHRAARLLARRLALGRDLYALAAPYGGLQRSQPFAVDEPLSEIGRLRGWTSESARFAVGTWARETYRADRHYVVLRIRQVVPSGPGEFQEFKNRAVQAAKAVRKKQRFEEKVALVRGALAAGATLDSLAAPYGGLMDSGPLSQTLGYVSGLGFEPRVVRAAFALKPGESSDTLRTANGVAWIRMEERVTPDATAFDTAAGPLTQELFQKGYNDWLEAKKQAVKIEILRPDLRRPPAPAARTAAGAGGG